MKYIIKDDLGVLATIDLNAFDTVREAQVAAVEELIEHYEESESSLMDDEERDAAIAHLHEVIEYVLQGEIGVNDVICYAGFEILFLEESIQ